MTSLVTGKLADEPSQSHTHLSSLSADDRFLKLEFHDADDTDNDTDNLARIIADTVSYTHLTLPTILRV